MSQELTTVVPEDFLGHVDTMLRRYSHSESQIEDFHQVQFGLMMRGNVLGDFDESKVQSYQLVLKSVQSITREHFQSWLDELRERNEQWIKSPVSSPFDTSNFIMDLSDIVHAEPPTPLFTLTNYKNESQLFMPRGKVCVLASEGGIGKSLLALHLGMAIALGADTRLRSRYGYKLKPVPKTGKVVLLYAEEDKQSCLFRMKQQLAGSTGRVDQELLRRLSGRLIPVPLCFNSGDSSISLSDSIRSGPTGADERREKLMQSLKAVGGEDGIDLIVVDPLAQFGGADFETDNGEASRLMRHLQQLTGLNGNPTVLIVHHSAKSNSKTPQKLANAFRGSSAIKDNARWAGILRRIGEDQTGENYLKDRFGRGVIELVVAKSNYGPAFLQARCISHDSNILEIENNDVLLKARRLKSKDESDKEYRKSVLGETKDQEQSDNSNTFQGHAIFNANDDF